MNPEIRRLRTLESTVFPRVFLWAGVFPVGMAAIQSARAPVPILVACFVAPFFLVFITEAGKILYRHWPAITVYSAAIYLCSLANVIWVWRGSGPVLPGWLPLVVWGIANWRVSAAIWRVRDGKELPKW